MKIQHVREVADGLMLKTNKQKKYGWRKSGQPETVPQRRSRNLS